MLRYHTCNLTMRSKEGEPDDPRMGLTNPHTRHAHPPEGEPDDPRMGLTNPHTRHAHPRKENPMTHGWG